jgi:hypothetical protein
MLVKVGKKNRLYEKCGKCPCNKLCCLIFWIIFVIVAVLGALAIALLVFFMYPRVPNLNLRFDKINLSLKPATPTLDLIVDLSLTVFNPNYFSIGLQDLTLEMWYWCHTTCLRNGSIPDNSQVGGVNFGNVRYTPQVIFPSLANFTGKALQVTIYGTGMMPTDWAKLMQDCSSSGAKEIALQFIGNTTALIDSIKVPFIIPLKIPTMVPCCQGVGC